MQEKSKKEKINSEKNKVRVNITVDFDKLERAKKKLNLFGGKLSTLFNLYLSEFIEGMDKDIIDSKKQLDSKIEELEQRIKLLEKK